MIMVTIEINRPPLSPIRYLNRQNSTQWLPIIAIYILMTRNNFLIEIILFQIFLYNFPMHSMYVCNDICLQSQYKTFQTLHLHSWKKDTIFYITIYLIKQDWCCPNKSILMSPSFSNKIYFLRKLFTDFTNYWATALWKWKNRLFHQ